MFEHFFISLYQPQTDVSEFFCIVPIEEETLGIHSNFHFDEEGMDEETSQLIRKLLEEDRLEQNLRETGVNLPTSSKSQLGGDGGRR